MDNDALCSMLQSLEVELHHPGVKCTRDRLERLLHPEFHEVGRSGHRYDRITVIDFLATHPTLPATVSADFKIELLTPGMALLAYRSWQHHPDGTRFTATHRMSLWSRNADGWQLRYHQGTPASDIA
jgi:hypothetical protein